MGLLCDIYISTADQAASYDDTQAVPASERAQLKGLTFLEFSTLWAILQHRPWEDAHMDAFECILQQDGGERLIYSFPPEFVAAAANVTSEQAATAAEEWAQTEELSCSAADVRPAIDELARLARVAQDSGRRLYLWNCV